MKEKHWLPVIVLLFGIWLITSMCATSKSYQLYEGEARPVSEIARLIVPDIIEIRLIDGEDFGNLLTSYFLMVDKELHFLPGPHTITIRYNDLWDIDGFDHEIITSDPIRLTFTAYPGKKYRIEVDEPRSRRAAREVALNFTVSLVEF